MIFPARGNGRASSVFSPEGSPLRRRVPVRAWAGPLAVLVMFLAAAAPLSAGGGAEADVLSRADELILNKEYDEAIRLLTEYTKGGPDRLAGAQSRLRKIVMIREEYNAVAAELLDTLEADPENSGRILELSNRLLTIESASNPATRLFLDQVRRLAELNVNRRQLETIFADGREQLARNDFSGALDTYASGLGIYRNLFFSAGYGPEAENAASDGLGAIDSNIQGFKELAGPFSRAARAAASVDGSGAGDPLSAYRELAPFMARFTVMQESFFQVRASFDAQVDALQAPGPALRDVSFLSFAGLLITGPEGRNEGMTGALDRFCRFWLDPATAALDSLAVRSYTGAYNSMLNQDYGAAVAPLEESVRYINAALDSAEGWNSFFLLNGSAGYDIYGETVSAGQGAFFLKLRAMADAVGYLMEVGEIAVRGSALENAPVALVSREEDIAGVDGAMLREEETRAAYQGLAQEFRALGERIGDSIGIVQGYRETVEGGGGSADGADTYLAGARDLALSLENRFGALERGSAVRFYTAANAGIQDRVRVREAEFNEGNTLIQGVREEREGIDAYTAYYPTEGVAVFSRLDQAIGGDIGAARDLVSRYSAEPLSGDPGIRALSGTAQVLLDRLLEFQDRAAGIMASARVQVQRAASLRLEGDRLFQAAQAALGRNDFTAARNSLTRATEQYNASLAVQESASLRATWDTQLVGLGGDIVRIENEIVVRDVRNMVTTARTRYYAGDMNQAEELLVRAQNRWRVTNVTEHQDVEYWLRLVRGALSLQSGRTIAPTAPLFAEMSQLLSDAKRGYDEGVRQINAGRRQAGLALFTGAAEKTSEVRLIFPMNQEARMIELRIAQQTDTPAFNASFRQRLNEAVAGTKTGNAESFADLQDLAELNPGYQGIQALLSQAEIDMGLRPPPPDPRALARSAELTRNAQAIINSQDSIRYGLAQTNLQDAIRLNPDNTQAQTLMDQLQIRMTGTGIIVLSSYAQDRYNLALQEFLRGNFLSANAIVEQLLQNQDSSRSTLIQDLKRRIDAVL